MTDNTRNQSKKDKKYTKVELSQMSHSTARKYARLQGIPRTTKKVRDTVPPKCSTPRCKNPRVAMDWHWINGTPVYRPICEKCHQHKTASKHGLKRIAQVVAKNAGCARISEYTNRYHPYLKYRKTYCENIDGRLGFVCTTSNIPEEFGASWLDVDHKDGNPTNNNEQNLQTLCKCCHAYKSWKNGDARTLGRKRLKEKNKKPRKLLH